VHSVYKPAPIFGAAIRGQNPTYEYDEFAPPDGLGGATDPSTSPGIVPNGQSYSPTQPGEIFQADPYLANPGVVPPGAGPQFAPQQPQGRGPISFAAQGPHPLRFGWTSLYEYAYLSSDTVSPALGDLEWHEFNSAWRYTTPSPWGKIYSFTPQFGMRSGSLPGGDNWYRFGLDLEAVTPTQGPWSLQFGFTPSINSDLEKSISSEAWQFDARGMGFYRVSPSFTWVLGAGFWDRVEDMVVPYAGFIYRPDTRWEYLLVLPQPRISYLISDSGGVATWLYVRAEYHVEAYETDLEGAIGQRQVQIEDGRLMGGVRFDGGAMAAFVEAGWVFKREFQVRDTLNVDLDDALMVRAGLQY
jgi:hypothetical protein